jgi:hypothetical protein
MKLFRLFSASTVLFLFLAGCAESGEDGDAGIDCGEYGSLHDGHCHCAEGFAYNGETCVALSMITTICAEEDHSDSDHAMEEEDAHPHEACLCASATACPCDGELTTTGANTYCLPALHEE